MPAITDTYEIKPGDTLSAIAQHFQISLADLLAANQQIVNPNVIAVGQVINIPDTQPPVAPPQPAPGATTVYDGIHPAPQTVSTNRASLIFPPLTNAPGNRQRAIYDQLVNQFAVQFNPRYIPSHQETFCNIFAWDVTRAMGVEIPHWINAAGQPVVPFTPQAHEQLINATVDWMHNHGVPQYGWQSCTPQQAQNAANLGQPTVVMWKNPVGVHGHIAVVRPGMINAKGAETAQAGGHNFNDGHVLDGFHAATGLLYFTHP